MEKLQGLIKVINQMGLCEIQCSVEKCPNTTVWNRDGNVQQSTVVDGIVSECDLCDTYFCWDHIDLMADVVICQTCSSEYWRGKYKELNEKHKNQNALLEEVCDLTDTYTIPCYDRTCNKVYVNSGKANRDFTLDGSKITSDYIHICNYCDQGYCSTHYNMLIPSVDDPKMERCRLCDEPKD